MTTNAADLARFVREFQRICDEINEVILSFQPTPDDPSEDLERALMATLIRFSALNTERRTMSVPAEMQAVAAELGEALDLQESAYRGCLVAIRTGDLVDLATQSRTLAASADRLNESSLRFLAAVEAVTGRSHKPDA